MAPSSRGSKKRSEEAQAKPSRQGKKAGLDVATAAEKWSLLSAEEQERFLATLETELARILKGIAKAKSLTAVTEIEEKMQIAALGSLHHHLHVSGAKHTALRRALTLAEQAAQFLQCVTDAVADRQPALLPGAEKVTAEVKAWTQTIVAAAGAAKDRGPKVVPTRGKTAPGRLRSLDAFVCQYMRETLKWIPGGILVDLGFGEVAVTTVEMARLMWQKFPDMHIIGVEASRARAEKAHRSWQEQTMSDKKTLGPCMHRKGEWTCQLDGKMEFRHGGFLMPLTDSERPLLCCVRAMNVLRQYESLAECQAAHCTITRQLVDDGLLFEGSSDPKGKVIVTYVLRRASPGPFTTEAIFFSLNLRALALSGGLSLDLVADNLPQLLFGRNESSFEDFFSCWRAAVEATDGGRGVRQHFQQAAVHLAATLPVSLGQVVTRSQWLRRGWLLWKNPSYPTLKQTK